MFDVVAIGTVFLSSLLVFAQWAYRGEKMFDDLKGGPTAENFIPIVFGVFLPCVISMLITILYIPYLIYTALLAFAVSPLLAIYFLKDTSIKLMIKRKLNEFLDSADSV